MKCREAIFCRLTFNAVFFDLRNSIPLEKFSSANSGARASFSNCEDADITNLNTKWKEF